MIKRLLVNDLLEGKVSELGECQLVSGFRGWCRANRKRADFCGSWIRSFREERREAVFSKRVKVNGRMETIVTRYPIIKKVTTWREVPDKVEDVVEMAKAVNGKDDFFIFYRACLENWLRESLRWKNRRGVHRVPPVSVLILCENGNEPRFAEIDYVN